MRYCIKKMMAVAIGLIMIINMSMTVYATEEVANTTEEPMAEEKSPELLAKEKATADAYAMKVESNEIKGWPQGPSTYNEASIVMDVNSGAILYAKNIDTKEYPASITKVLTSLIALENGNATDKVTFTDDCVSFMKGGYSSIGMKAGEEISLNDALYAMLLASANEVAYAIAANVGENYDSFIQKMNQRAVELNCKNSHFVNANGLHDSQHYTTARDMALIGSEVIKHEEFKTITETLQYTIAPTSIVPEERIFQQKHRMLKPTDKYYYENCIAGKTGYTDEALSTLITWAQKDNLELVCVVLKSHGKNLYPDTRNLFDYAYGNFTKVPVRKEMLLEKDRKSVKTMAEDAYVVLPNGVDVKELETTIMEDKENKKDGIVSYTYKGEPVGTTKVTLNESYFEKNKKETNIKKTEKKDSKKKRMSPKKKLFVGIMIVLGAVATLAILLGIGLILRKRELKRRHRKRRRRKRDRRL